jgi:serine protease Do
LYGFLVRQPLKLSRGSTGALGPLVRIVTVLIIAEIGGSLAMKRIVITSVFLLALFPTRGTSQLISGTPVADTQQIEKLVARVDPATVEIEVKTIAIESPEDNTDQAGYLVSDEAFGTGTIVSPDGLIVTNEHVVHGAQSILVTLVGQDTPYKATVLGRDTSVDLALLKIHAATPSHFDLNAAADVQYGEFVLAFGSPFGFGHSVSFGIVSSPLRETEFGPYRYIQTDAPVNPGNSGGPLVDLHGNLVGINTLIYSVSGGSEGVGFALPLATVRRAIESIRRFGYVRRSNFGLSLAPISESISRGLHLPRTGLLVEDVDLGGPAAIAGMRSGDRLVSVHGVPVSSFEDLDAATYALPDAKPVMVDFQRASHVISVPITPVFYPDRPSSLEDIEDIISPAQDTIARLGIVAVNYGEQLRNIYPDARKSDGVVVAAMSQGIEPGARKLHAADIVYAVNGIPIHNVDDLRTRLNEIPPDEPVVLQLERDGHLRYITVDQGNLQ